MAIADPDNIIALDQLRALLKDEYRLTTNLASESDILRAIDQYYGFELSIDGILHEIEPGEMEYQMPHQGVTEFSQPVVRLIDALLTEAVQQGASDIHFEPESSFLRIRYRIDGVLRPVQDPVLAGNWMKLFARGGTATLRAVDRHFGNMSKTILFLKEALSRPEDLASILKRHGLEGESQWRRLLFPSTPVYVYLNHDLFEKAPWWYYFGTGGLISGEAVRPRVLFLAPGRFSFDPKKGLISFQGLVQPVSRLHLAQFQPTPRILGSLTFGNAGGPIVVLEKELGVGYLFDASMSDSLFVKLLLLEVTVVMAVLSLMHAAGSANAPAAWIAAAIEVALAAAFGYLLLTEKR